MGLQTNKPLLENDHEDQEMTQQEYMSFYQKVVEKLRHIFSLSASKKFSNEDFIALGRDDEEKQAIAEGCEDIDNYYEELSRVMKTDENESDYLVERLKEIAQEDGEQVDEEELKKAVDDFLDKSIISEAENILKISNSEINQLKNSDHGNNGKEL